MEHFGEDTEEFSGESDLFEVEEEDDDFIIESNMEELRRIPNRKRLKSTPSFNSEGNLLGSRPPYYLLRGETRRSFEG